MNTSTDVETSSRSWFGPETRTRVFARVSKARREIVTLVENNPLAAVGAATALGFVFARMLRR
jgi:ElaB/YqjD/DUF883 family membrane-anchored ribosome-binding protein